MVEEPKAPAQLLGLEEVGVQQHQGVLDVVEPFFHEHELQHRQHVHLSSDDSFLGDGRFHDPGDGLEAPGSSKFGLAVVVFLVGLLCIFSEEFEEEFGEVFDQLDCEGFDLAGEVFDDAFEGVDDVF